MKYFYDTEFLEDGKTIDLISIGIVAEDGCEYYAVNVDADWERIFGNTWLMRNVWPHLPVNGYTEKLMSVGGGKNEMRMERRGHLDHTDVRVKPKWVIRNEVRAFLLRGFEPAGLLDDGSEVYFDTDVPELWAWYAAYDHVALAQLFGRMIDLPKGIPMWTNDLRQEVSRLGDPKLPEQEGAAHNALEDARHLAAMYRAVASLG